jgi:hypothetical protein
MIIDYVVNVHGDNVCAKKYCTEPDSIDHIVQPVYYTGVSGMRELINILRNPEKYAERLRFLFIDDVWDRSFYLRGGDFRRLYQAMNEYLKRPRDFTKIIIATGQKKEFIPPLLLQPRSVHYADYTVINDDGKLMNVYEYRVWTRAVYKKHYFGRFGPYERWASDIDLVYSDVVSKKAIFGLPEWLEKNISERKTFEIKAFAEWAYEALKNMKEWEPKDESKSE